MFNYTLKDKTVLLIVSFSLISNVITFESNLRIEKIIFNSVYEMMLKMVV